MPRMRILSAAEQARFDQPPVFNSEERKKYLDFSGFVVDVAESLRSPVNQIGFLLDYGYFSATRRFLGRESYHLRDIEYVSRALDLPLDTFSPDRYAKMSRLRNQARILDLQGFRPFELEAQNQLISEITQMVRHHLNPRLIFWRCTDFLLDKRIQLPGAQRLTDLIRAQLSGHKQDLIRLVDRNLSTELRVMLDDLFTREDNRYRLTLLKKILQSTRPGKVKRAVDDLEDLKNLHDKIEPVLGVLNIGFDGIRYHAGAVYRSDIFHLQRRSEADRYLHVIAFIADQHNRLHDALVDVLLSVMQSFKTTVEREHKEDVFAQRQTLGPQIEKMLDDVDKENCNFRNEIRVLLDHQTKSDVQKLDGIRAILDRDDHNSGTDILRADIRKRSADDEVVFHGILEGRSIRLQNRISPILKQMEFIGGPDTAELMDALTYFREKDGNIGPGMPLAFLTSTERDAVASGPKGFRVSLCKVFLFQHVAGSIKAGSLNLEGSYKYRPLDDYLISRERWQQEKADLLKRAGLTDFVDPEPILKELKSALQHQYETTNRAAHDGSNTHLKIRSPGNFWVATPALDEVESEPLRDVMPKQYLVPLSEVLATVDQHCGMLGEFKHWQQVNVDQTPSTAITIAGIMGLGCAIGVQKMARISHGISERGLEYAVNWRFSLDNIIAANDRVVAAMERMELPQIYRRSQEAVHTSSDGQKFEVRKPSLNANYSFKYFGQIQGVSAYTFIDERGFLWYSLVFSAAERESAYVIDGLMHNDVVRSTIHSTDEHGYMEAIFCVTHLLGISFAPRFKDLKKHNLYRFRNTDNNEADWSIIPSKYVNETVIRRSWDDLLRLVTTIKLKEATASEIFRRLNSYSQQHSLYATMKAFGQIIKSIFILRYIDQVELRQAIEKQLSKVELANSFTRAVAVGNPRGIEHAEKEDQEIAEGCNRLIKNSIICWNYLYLTKELKAAKTEEEKLEILNMLVLHSPQTWWFVNMLGEYDLTENKLQDNTGVLSPKSATKIIPTKWGPPKR